MNYFHPLLIHETNDAVNEELRRLITDHANLSTRGKRSEWYYAWHHELVKVYFRSKADWAHFEETFERRHDAFLRANGLIDPSYDTIAD